MKFKKIFYPIRLIILLLIIIEAQNVRAVDLKGSIFSHDPATITKENNVYWHFYTAPGIGAAYSYDLETWTYSGNHIFTPGSNWKQNYPAWTIPYFGTTNTDGNLWAPDIIYMNGAYYLYYSCSSFGSSYSAIGVVRSETLNNPSWQDSGMVVNSSSWSDINAIDPALFRDDDGKVYMVYGSWSGGIGIVDIDTVSGKATSSVTKLYGGDGLDTEAAYLFKEGTYYYLVVNRGTCCKGVNSGYYILVGRSSNVKGPYSDFRTLLPNKDGKYIGPGHFSLLRDTCGYYVATHYYNANNNGSATLDILKMRMVDGWPLLYREFTFDNCDEELFVDAGSDEESCENVVFDLSSSSTIPKAYFYSTLLWDDGGTGGSFDDATMLRPKYTPPENFTGNITLKLNVKGIDPSEVVKDSSLLTIIKNPVFVDAGSNEKATGGKAINLSGITTPPSASEYNSLKWDDGGAGGQFSNYTLLEPLYAPPEEYKGTITLTLSANGDANCSNKDSLVLSVGALSINSLNQYGIKIYPNPVNGIIQIHCPGLSQKTVKYKIIELSGKIVQQGKLSAEIINISKLNKGYYILNLNINGDLINKEIVIK